MCGPLLYGLFTVGGFGRALSLAINSKLSPAMTLFGPRFNGSVSPDEEGGSVGEMKHQLLSFSHHLRDVRYFLLGSMQTQPFPCARGESLPGRTRTSLDLDQDVAYIHTWTCMYCMYVR
ncbi:hypothetical protein XA68_11867 [Ophiocordyceps unilateralis]|uniref:Uncharacterized protein n=1 Tax=Ophiocordyceps unilateralis TaxID=268505 RepID=A0A2A9P1G0_OPHUN|nr:hypothetical protein XA68_11867 [Ophiocordyceps unilateralis]